MEPLNISSVRLEAGTMMVQEGLLLPKFMEMATDAYSRPWRSVQALDSFSLGRVLDAFGWHLFSVAGQVTSVAFGFGGEKSLHKAVQRIAAKVSALDLNCLELTEISKRHFLGMPYIAICAQLYHIQEGWQLQSPEQRRRLQRENVRAVVGYHQPSVALQEKTAPAVVELTSTN